MTLQTFFLNMSNAPEEGSSNYNYERSEEVEEAPKKAPQTEAKYNSCITPWLRADNSNMLLGSAWNLPSLFVLIFSLVLRQFKSLIGPTTLHN